MLDERYSQMLDRLKKYLGQYNLIDNSSKAEKSDAIKILPPWPNNITWVVIMFQARGAITQRLLKSSCSQIERLMCTTNAGTLMDDTSDKLTSINDLNFRICIQELEKKSASRLEKYVLLAISSSQVVL